MRSASPVTEMPVNRSANPSQPGAFPWERGVGAVADQRRGTSRVTNLHMTPEPDTTPTGEHAAAWLAAVDQWRPWLSVSGSAGTVRLRTFHITHLAPVMPAPPETITLGELVAVLADARSRWSPATRKSYVASLRAFFRWLQAAGRRVDNPGPGLPSVTVPRGVPRPTPETLVDAALARCRERGDARLYLSILLAAECGLRRGEISRVHSDDVEMVDGGPNGPEPWLRVEGKGGHVRMVYLSADLAEGLRFVGGLLWESAYRRGHPVDPDWVGRCLKRELGATSSAHKLRHRAATNAYNATGDVAAVQKMLGHAKPETTMVYVDVGNDSVRRAGRGAQRVRP